MIRLRTLEYEMTRKFLVLLTALLLSGTALACMGTLISSQVMGGGVACTYQLSDGSRVRVFYPGTYACPFCME